MEMTTSLLEPANADHELIPIDDDAHFEANASSSPKASRICLSSLSMLITLRIFDYCFHNQMCNLIFRCGCTWEWAGGWKNCNVHNKTGPRCPWCDARRHLVWSVAPAFVCTLGMAGFVVFGLRYLKQPSQRRLALMLTMPFIIWLLYSFFIGLMFYWGTNYPWFLWFKKHR
eukprot:TRINITY_DN5936_c0_g2_i1.p1 TRINITY_DN5936_c0_g2~~TRINITY_DN5936_c0_g2_i1.p1  ORF type:complete len:172 (+),score=15.01 TRINITY_DN5936_c0_g2_i1:274-789(+)